MCSKLIECVSRRHFHQYSQDSPELTRRNSPSPSTYSWVKSPNILRHPREVGTTESGISYRTIDTKIDSLLRSFLAIGNDGVMCSNVLSAFHKGTFTTVLKIYLDKLVEILRHPQHTLESNPLISSVIPEKEERLNRGSHTKSENCADKQVPYSFILHSSFFILHSR